MCPQGHCLVEMFQLCRSPDTSVIGPEHLGTSAQVSSYCDLRRNIAEAVHTDYRLYTTHASQAVQVLALFAMHALCKI